MSAIELAELVKFCEEEIKICKAWADTDTDMYFCGQIKAFNLILKKIKSLQEQSL